MNDFPGTRGEMRTMIRPPEAKNEIFRNEWKPDFKSTAALQHSVRDKQLITIPSSLGSFSH